MQEEIWGSKRTSNCLTLMQRGNNRASGPACSGVRLVPCSATTSTVFVATSLRVSMSVKIRYCSIAFFWVGIAHFFPHGISYVFRAGQWYLPQKTDPTDGYLPYLPGTQFSTNSYRPESSINPIRQAKELRLYAVLQQIRSRNKCQVTRVPTLFLNLFYCRA